MAFHLQIESLDNDTVLVRPVGPVTVESDLAELVQPNAKRVVLDLSQIPRIDSLGVREWIRAMRKLPEGQAVVWDQVSPAMSAQVAMISNFVGPGRIASFIIPWWCNACGTEHETHVQAHACKISGFETPDCPACAAQMVLDELDEGYVEALLEHAT